MLAFDRLSLAQIPAWMAPRASGSRPKCVVRNSLIRVFVTGWLVRWRWAYQARSWRVTW